MPPTPADATDSPSATDGSTGTDGSSDREASAVPTDGTATEGSSGRGPSRRRVLRTLVNAGYGAGIAAAVERTGVLGDDGWVPVTYALVHDEPGDPTSLKPRTTTVPARWRDSLMQSFELRKEFAELDLSGVHELFVVPGSFDSPTPSFSLTVADGSIRDQLAERFGAVDVDLDVSILDETPSLQTPEPTKSDPVTLSEARRDVPGGVACSTGEGSRGSLAPALYNGETQSKWLTTSNHLYGADGTKRTAHAGEPLFVLTDGGQYKVGEVVRGYPNEDVVGVRPAEGVKPTSTVYDEATVAGQFTRFGLAVLRARDEPLQKVGAFSGHTSGTIKGIDGITCYAGDVCKTGQLKWGDETTLVDGDSGSVNFHPDPEHPDHVLLGGFNNARTWWPGADFAWGTAAYHLAETQGLHF